MNTNLEAVESFQFRRMGEQTKRTPVFPAGLLTTASFTEDY